MNETTLVELWLKSPTDKYVLVLILGLNLILTLVHCSLELKGYLWRYFGAIAGFRIPDKLGFFLFFVGLLAILWIAGFLGIAAPLYGIPMPKVAMVSVAIIVGGRISDSIYSHIRLHRKGYRPNPALGTVPYYLAEAAILAILFSPEVRKQPGYAALGFILGWMLFFSVLPLIRWFRSKITSLRREPWQAGDLIPLWVQEYDVQEVRGG